MSRQPITTIPPPPPPFDRRSLLAAAGATAAVLLAGCLAGPSSGGPPYESHEVDDWPVYAPGLADESERAYFAALVTSEDEADAFDWRRAREADRAFVEGTDFRTSYLGLVQVSALNSSMRFEVVDLHESDVSLTVVVAVRDPTPRSDDRVISTLLLRVDREGGGGPARIAVELDIGDHHETFSGE